MHSNVVLPGQFVLLIDSLLAVLSEIDLSVQRADAYVCLVLSCLPWAAPQLRDRNLMELERIFQTLSEYMSNRPAVLAKSGIHLAHQSLALYRDVTIDTPYVQKDYLDLIWAQMQDLKQHDWETFILANPYKLLLQPLSSQLQHEIPPVSVPSSVSVVKFIYQPKVWIFNDSVNVVGEKAICHLPSTFSVSRYVLDDMITDTIRMFSHNHLECTALLLKVEKFFNGDYVAKHGF
ncbi:Nuclear cap-binding protein subunit 1, partial [Kappamyces sp. JEL0680]